MSICVNLNSKTFKDCCKRLNVSARTLEPIIHDFINIEGNEDSFPSDAYIESKIHGKETTVISENQIKLWEKQYSKTKIFNTVEEANFYIKEASQFFQKEAFGFKETTNGKYEVTIVKPKYVNLSEIKKKLNEELSQNENAVEQYVTAAPYFRQKLTSANKEELESKTQEALKYAKELAKLLGVEIVEIQTIGGTYLGSSEISYKYILKNTDAATADLFASIMADLNYEYQDATIASNYVENGGNALELTFSVPEGTTIEEIEKILNDHNIEGSSFDFKQNKLTILAFDEKDIDVILTSLKNTNFKLEEYAEQNSRYLDNESRRNIYKTWLKSEENKQNRSLYYACSKALAICEAASKYPKVEQEAERLKATKKAAKFWDINHETEIFFQKRDSIKENKRELVRQHYQPFEIERAHRLYDKANALKKAFQNIQIKVNYGNDAGEIDAESQVIELINNVKSRLGWALENVYHVKIDESGETRYEVRIKLKTQDEFENYCVQRVERYIKSLSEEALNSEVARLENEESYDEYDDIAYHIKSKDIPVVREQIAKRNPYLTEEELNETIDFLVSLENNPETNLYVKQVISWIKNGTIQLPRHNDTVKELFKTAREIGLNIQKYYSPFDMIPDIISYRGGEIKEESGINPFNVKEFHFVKRVVSADGKEIDIFDVDDTEDGAQAVSQALADTTPKLADGDLATGHFSSPWCLAVFKYKKDTKKAQREEGANRMWFETYNKGKRQIAFYNGYPVAFNSSSQNKDQWWDFRDISHDDVSEIKVSTREEVYNNNISATSNYEVMVLDENTIIYFNNDGTIGEISQLGLYWNFNLDEENKRHSINTYYGRSTFKELIEKNVYTTQGLANIKNIDEETGITFYSVQYKKEFTIKNSLIINEYHQVTKLFEELIEGKKEILKTFLSKGKLAPTSLITPFFNKQNTFTNLWSNFEKLIQSELQNYLDGVYLEEYKKNQNERKEPKPQVIDTTVATAVVENTLNEIEKDLKEFEFIHPTESSENKEYNFEEEETNGYQTEEDYNFVNNNEEVKPFKKLVSKALKLLKTRNYETSYSKGLQKEVNKELEGILKEILEKYHFETLEADLKDVFGDDILGATDFLNKVIYLANEGDRNALTGIEEFAHAFVKLMGSAYHKPENRKKFPETAEYSRIRDLVEGTSLYQKVLETYGSLPGYQRADGTPDTKKLKEEAVGQALAAVILERYEIKNNKDKNFFDKLVQWFKDLLLAFKAIFDDGAELDKRLNKIADSIFDGTYDKKFLEKLNDKEYHLQNYEETILNDINNGGEGLRILQHVNETGGYITGSLAYRKQTNVYRKEEDSLHDLDVVYPLSAHGWHKLHPYWRTSKAVTEDRKYTNEQLVELVKEIYPIRNLLEKEPNMEILYVYPDADNNVVINAVVSEDHELIEKFRNLTGNYATRLKALSEEERNRLHIVDIFLHKTDNITKDIINDEQFNLKLTNYKHSFRAKLKYGRAKDIYDYQRLNPTNRDYKIDVNTTMLQKVTDRINLSSTDKEFIEEKVLPTDVAKQYGLTTKKLTEAVQSFEEIHADTERLSPVTMSYKEFKDSLGEMDEVLRESLKDWHGEEMSYNKNTKEITIPYKYIYELYKHYNQNKEFWDFIENETGFSIEEYLETDEIEGLFNALYDAGIMYQYDDSRQGVLFDERGLTQSEIDAQNKEKQKKFEKYNKIFEDSLALISQITELTKSELVTMSEVKEMANNLAYALSDLITQWQDDPDNFFKDFPELQSNDPTKDYDKVLTMSRAELVEFIGVSKLLEELKKATFNKDFEGETEDKAMLYYENFDALMRFAMDAFNSVEDFHLKFSETGVVVEHHKLDNETDTLSNEEQSAQEELGDKQEHWQVDSRTIDNFLSMSQIVKRELVRCYKLDDQKNPIVNEFGIKERVDPKDATSSILRWTQGALTLEDMIVQLKEKEKTNPWLSTIIAKLESNDKKDVEFKGQFFTVFCKHFQEYYIIKEFKDRDGKVYRTMPVNVNPALKEVMDNINGLIKLQEHPLFNSNGVIEPSFRELEKTTIELVDFTNVPFDTLDKTKLSEHIVKCAKMLGFDTSIEMVEVALTEENLKNMIKALTNILTNLQKSLGNTNYDPLTYDKEGYGIRGYLRDFLKPITDILEDTAVSSFFDSGKMYQSYVIPSFMTKLMRKLQHASDAEFKKFVEEEYGKYDWFKDKEVNNESGYKNVWLRTLLSMSAEERRKNFGHKVQLNYLGKNYMRNMSGPEYVLSILTEYFSKDSNSKESSTTAWYKIPMMSNKPSLEFIKFTRYTGASYENTLLDGFYDIFNQELDRIITVRKRNYDKKDDKHITSFDTNGKKFNFLTFLNPYLEGKGELGELLVKYLDGEELTAEEELNFESLIRGAIKNFMDEKATEIIKNYKESGIFKEAKKIDGIGKTDEEVEASIREFVWNDTFAAMNILQLTITDIAYYKNAEDLQKRLAQIHAPGMRGNTSIKDYKGRPVTDGKLRAAFLTDIEGEAVIYNIIDNLEIVFDKKIERAKQSGNNAEVVYYEELKKKIIKQFKEDINVADAQAFNCPTSYRKKALMFGKWNEKYEEIYEKLKNGKANVTEIETAFQVVKPFVYTNTEKSSGVENAPLSNLKVGMQFKNSEYLLIMADALIQSEDTGGKPNLLRAIFNMMEKSAEKDNTKGIDTVMFASAVKAGLHGRLNLAPFMETGKAVIDGVEMTAQEYLEKKIYGDNPDGYNDTYVHTFPAEDYSIQQEVPKHFMDHSQVEGSQERYIIPSDLESELDENGNETIFYEFDDNGKHKKLTAKQFKAEYEAIHAESINESIRELERELGLDETGDQFIRNVALSQVLQKEIISSPRYGMDLFFACSLDENGNFNIPLGDPIQSKRIEQLINSIVKNRINKQKIAGGPVVQVSNFGMSKQLHIKFNDKEGNLLPTLDEWLEKEENKDKTVEDYKAFIKDNQGGIAHYECYAPAFMQEFLEAFMDENGNIDMEAVEKVAPEVLEMVGYRIPTEDKYSIAPLKIVGFLPKEAGEAIVLPYEITLITGSDFDVDKFYIMRKTFEIKYKKFKDAKQTLKEHLGKNSEIEDFLNLLQNSRIQAYTTYPDIAKVYRRECMLIALPKEGKYYRDNKTIDMTLAVLKHPTTADKILNPGGFEPQQRMGYLVTAYKAEIKRLKDNNVLMKEDSKNIWERLKSYSTGELKAMCMTDKNLSFIDVNTQFYEQNNAAGSILGMFAVQKIAHAVLEGDGLLLDVSSALKLIDDTSFLFMGKGFRGLMEFDGTKNWNGEYIGKVLGSLVASAADAVKDPVLNLMNINNTTANVLTTMIRFGIPFESASLLLSQKIIADCLKEFNVENLSGFTTFDVIIEKKIKELEEKESIKSDNKINFEDLTEEELIRGLAEDSDNINYKVLKAYYNFMQLSKELKGPTYATRFNSISNAVGPLVIDNLIMKNKLNKFSPFIKKQIGEVIIDVKINDIFDSHPILKGFRSSLDTVDKIFGKHMPLNNEDFQEVLNALPDDIADRIYGDRKLLGKLADFYLSYLLVNSKCIDPTTSKGLDYYINTFPKEFINSKVKEKYPNNPFIQAIRVSTVKGANGEERVILKLDTTGLDTIKKERLISGWESLFKTDFNLAMKLFKYCFYKGGIGFTPKTFMHLLPTRVKRLIPKYMKSFSTDNSIANPSFVIDQFIRNNWQNNKLAPTVKTEENDLMKPNENGIINVSEEAISKFKKLSYCKIEINKEKKLFKVNLYKKNGKLQAYLTPLSILGNNGEYLEISTVDINKPLTNTTETMSDEELFTPDSMPESTSDNTEIIKKRYMDIAMDAFGQDYFSDGRYETFKARSEQEKTNLKNQFKKVFEKKFAEKGIKFNMEEFDKLYEAFCG